MKDAREEFSGWVWVATGGVASILVPLWLLLTAVIVQLTPELAGLGVQADETGALIEGADRLTGPEVALLGGATAAVWIAAAAPFVLIMAGLAWALGRVSSRRQRLGRLALDRETSEDAVLQGVGLEVTPSPTAGPSPPEVRGTDSLQTNGKPDTGRRVGAKLLDIGMLMLAVVPGQIYWVSTLISTGLPPSGWVRQVILLTSLAALAIVVLLQGVLVARTGQTVGKRAFRLRVVRSNGVPADLLRSVVLRQWVFASVCVLVPIIGWMILPMIDLALLFGEEGRALHDLLSDTMVVDA